MRRQARRALMALALLATLASACSSDDGPTDVVQTFLEGIVAAGDPSGDPIEARLSSEARETLTPRLQAALIEAGDGNLLSGIEVFAAVRGLPPAFEIGAVFEQEDSALVETAWEYPFFPAEVTLSLVRVEGRWLIDALGPSGAAVAQRQAG